MVKELLGAVALLASIAGCSMTSEARRPDPGSKADGGAKESPLNPASGDEAEWKAAEAIAVREGTRVLMKPRAVTRLSPGVRYGFVVDPAVGKRQYVLVRGGTVHGGQGTAALVAFARAVDLPQSREWSGEDGLAVVRAYGAWPPGAAGNPEAYHNHPAGDPLADLNPRMEYGDAEARFILHYDVEGGPAVGRGSAVGPKLLYLDKYTLRIAGGAASWTSERTSREIPRFP